MQLKTTSKQPEKNHKTTLKLKRTKVTTGNQKWAQTALIRSFLPEGHKKPRTKPSAGARIRPA